MEAGRGASGQANMEAGEVGWTRRKEVLVAGTLLPKLCSVGEPGDSRLEGPAAGKGGCLRRVEVQGMGGLLRQKVSINLMCKSMNQLQKRQAQDLRCYWVFLIQWIDLWWSLKRQLKQVR